MTSDLQPPTVLVTDRISSDRSAGERMAGIAQGLAKLAVAAGVVLALWLLGNWLVGADHVATLSADTVDGGTVGRGLAFLIWVALAVAVVFGIVATRRCRSCETRSVEASSSIARQAMVPPLGTPAMVGRAARDGTRWTALGIISTGAGALFVIGTYHGLLLPGAITWGDWGYFVNAGAVRSDFPVPSLWSFATLGSSNILGAALAPIGSAMGVLARLGVPYAVLERIWFYFPAVVLSYAGPVVLARRLRASWPIAAGVGVFYSVNPYALVLISGGQLTVGVGYALFPWVALAAIRLWSSRTFGSGVLLGSVVGVQAWYDPRTAGLSIAGMGVALLVLAASAQRSAARYIPWVGAAASALVFLLLQGAWVVPSLFAVRAQLPTGYTTTSALATFSLLSLADGLTVFHPFWPSMHFIALYSVPALWLIVPVAVGVSLVRDPSDRRVHIGGAIYLVFAALLSGANPPIGIVNSWLFIHVPGMDLFRDPSPYLGPIALGVVIVAVAPATWRNVPVQGVQPYAVETNRSGADVNIGAELQRHVRPNLSRAAVVRSSIAVLAAAMIVVSAWPALSGALHHDLAPRAVPARYVRIDRAILGSPPGAVLWVPSTSRFAPVSPQHPSVSAITLESTNGVDFPSIVQGLEWLSVPSLVETLLQRYDIHTVVVREDAAPYVNLSLAARATRSDALSSFKTLPSVSETRFPSMAVFHLPAAPAYPVSVFHQPAAALGATAPTVAAPSGMVLAPSRQVLASNRQELVHTSFADGLIGWGAVGDGNNYLHQTLSQAGITATVRGKGNRHWLHLTVRYGAAVVSQALPVCPSSGLQEFRIRYRTSASSSLAMLVFSGTQLAPIGDLSLPETSGRWVTTTLPFVIAPTLAAAARAVSLSDCELVLSAQPAVAGRLSSADIASLSLEAATTTVSASVATTTQPRTYWGSPTRPPAVHMASSGDSTALTVPAEQHSRLVVFWQRYDPGWVARGANSTTLRHVEVNGWANGFIVPKSYRSIHIEIIYTPQHLSADGFLMVIVGLAILLAVAAVTCLSA